MNSTNNNLSTNKLRWAISANCVGTLLLAVSLFVNSPLGFTITLAGGSLFILAGIVILSLIVIREAIVKGMFR
jgi:hypothetical protein